MNILINVDVPNLQQAIAFYCQGIGLELNRLLDDDTAEIRGTSCMIYLLQKKELSTAVGAHGITRAYSRHWTPVHMDFVVEDLEAATKRVEEAGATRESECVLWRGSKCISFCDPFGHGFCLIEFSEGTYSD